MSIRWTRSDFVSLGKTISNFNKKRDKLLNEENKNILPSEQNYRYMKEDIKTRSELTRYINKLKRFNKPGSEEIIELEGRRVTYQMGI